MSTKKNDNAATATLSDGKVSIKQKALAVEKHSATMQEIVEFRKMLDNSTDVLSVIPDEFRPLIAKLAHESTLLAGGLARSIRKHLLADPDATPDRCPPHVVEAAIHLVADRVNYGLDSTLAPLCEWRWELKDLDMLPEDLREKSEARRAERVKAKDTLRQEFEALPADKQQELTAKKSRKTKDAKPADASQDKVNGNAAEGSAAAAAVKETTPAPNAAQNEENSVAADTPDPSTKKTKADGPSKDSLKKAVKEKQKQETEKSSVKFLSFFKPGGKPAADAGPSSVAVSASPGNAAGLNSSRSRKASTENSDFAAAFRPFNVRKGVILSNTNRFTSAKYLQSSAKTNAVEVNKNGVPVINLCSDDDGATSHRDILKTFIASVPPSYRLPSTAFRSRNGVKASAPYSVKDTMDQLNDAEIEGDEITTALLHKQLSDPKRFRVKLLQYEEDFRPPYWGTWTKASKTVGPRAPFAKHAELNYEYDSEEDWDEEEENAEGVGEELAAEAMSDDSGESDQEADDDDELGSFLAPEDEDMGELDGEPPEIDDDLFFAPSFGPRAVRTPAATAPAPSAKPSLTKKRKSMGGKDKNDKRARKKRKVQALVAWHKGVCYEDAEGRLDVPGFKNHRIRLLNDAPFSIDPFGWSSAPAVVAQPPAAHVPGTFAVPALPVSLAPSNGALPVASTSSSSVASIKHPFPAEYLPTLLQIVQAGDSKLSTLVDKVHAALVNSTTKVYRNSIEQQIRMSCSRVGKKWVVKPEFMHIATLNQGTS